MPLTKVVVRAEPLKLTTALGTKLVPFTVIVKPASPAFFVDGEMLVVVGTGLFTVTIGWTAIFARAGFTGITASRIVNEAGLVLGRRGMDEPAPDPQSAARSPGSRA